MSDTQDQTEARFDARDPLRALMLLSRLPVRGADGTRAAASAWAWPLVGLVVGALMAMAALLVLSLGQSPMVAALVAVALSAVVTGALHEDGLADCADGFWGGQSRERRLEIMKDSRIGSYGVLALGLVVALRVLLLAELIGAGAVWSACLVPACLSRAAMVMVMARLPFARADGLAVHVGRPNVVAALWAVALAAGLGLLAVGPGALWACLAVAGAAWAIARLALARIGGQTGDVLGAVQMLGEGAALLALTVVLSAG